LLLRDPALTGILGYFSFGPDHTYHLSFALGDNATTVIGFFGNTTQAWVDEGFGVDNVVLTGNAITTPESSTWAMMVVGLGFSGAAMRRKRRLAVRYDFVGALTVRSARHLVPGNARDESYPSASSSTAARSSAMPIPFSAEVTAISGCAAGCLRATACVAAVTASSSLALILSALVSTMR